MEGKMKALVYKAEKVVEIEERNIPVPKSDEVLIQVKEVSICGSDLGAYRHASERFKTPLVLGHEFSGVITEVGADVKDYKVGQRVTVNPIVKCNDCFHCNKGEANLCGNRASMGTAIGGERTDGAMREYVTVKDWMVIPIADNVSFKTGAMLEPCGVCLAAAKCGYDKSEKNVVVIGTGPIGFLITKFLKAMGVPNVICSDIVDFRLGKAKEFGADHTINAKDEDVVKRVKELTNGYGADRVIIAAGVGSVINQSFEMVRNGGTIVLVALMHEMVTIDPMEIVGRGIKFLGSYMFTTEMAEAAQMFAEGKLNVEELITSSFPLERGNEAFEVLDTPNNSEIKVQISMK